MISVLIVEDSVVIAELLTTVLNSDPGICIAGICHNSEEAIAMTAKLRPDVITMDMHMPGMNGLETTKEIMAFCPTPILILNSSTIQEKPEPQVFEALAYGALDVMEKYLFEGKDIDETAKTDLISKIKLLSKVHVISHPLAKIEKRHKKTPPIPFPRHQKAGEKIIGMVASTGGPHALLEILKNFPADFPVPILVVQHISPGFAEGLVEWLNQGSNLNIQIAQNHAALEPGIVYMAPTELQMRISAKKRIELTEEPPFDGQRPSGNLLLQSVADVYGEQGLGILLTGMGSDGAKGLKAIQNSRGHTIAQNEKSSVIFGMPKAAIDMRAANEIIPLDKIAEHILKWTKGQY